MVEEKLQDALRALCEADRPRPWLRILTVIAAILVSLMVLNTQLSNDDALKAKDDTIDALEATLNDVRESLDRFTESDDCLAAFSRRITDTQNRYLTDGLGGLVSALALPQDTPDRAGRILTAVVEHDRLRDESRQSVIQRDAYVLAGGKPPCPVPTASN